MSVSADGESPGAAPSVEGFVGSGFAVGSDVVCLGSGAGLVAMAAVGSGAGFCLGGAVVDGAGGAFVSSGDMSAQVHPREGVRKRS